MDAHQLFRAGRLSDAVAAISEEIRSKPTDTDRRWTLVEMLCLGGRLDRADAQLEVIGQQAPDAVPGVSLLRQLIRAETARREVFAQGRLPEFLAPPDAGTTARLRALVAIRAGQAREAADLLAEAEAARVPLRGACDGAAFEDLRDLDDVTADVFEVLTSTGKYYWIPMRTVTTVEFRPPARPRDLLWRRAAMSVRDGPEGEVYVSALYPGTDAAADESMRLGRATDWSGGDGAPVRGLGQRTLLVGEDARPILEIGSLRIEPQGS